MHCMVPEMKEIPRGLFLCSQCENVRSRTEDMKLEEEQEEDNICCEVCGSPDPGADGAPTMLLCDGTRHHLCITQCFLLFYFPYVFIRVFIHVCVGPFVCVYIQVATEVFICTAWYLR